MDPDLTINLVRTIDVPRDRVYAALTTPEIGEQWWGSPPWDISSLTLDARPGGRFEFNMVNSDNGTKYSTHGEYKEAVPNERLVWTNAEGGGTEVTVELRETDTGTELSVTQGEFPDSATRDQHAQGWSGAIDSMKRLLEGS